MQVVLSFDSSAVSELSGCDSHGFHHLPSAERADRVQLSESHTTLTDKHDHASIKLASVSNATIRIKLNKV